MFVYLNGEVVKKEEAVISPFDHGFLYGMGLFETFRVYNGHPFLLDDHLERLNNGLKALNIQVQYTREKILSPLSILIEKNNLTDAYIRLNISAGIGEIGLQTTPYVEPNLMIFAKSLPQMNTLEKTAVILNIKRNTPEGYERLKSHHYLNNILAKREIGDKPDYEGIFLTTEGYLAEGVVSNLFWIKDNVLYTPTIDTGILNGITRQFVMKLARKNGMDIQEGFFLRDSVMEADEIFVTNSIQEIIPIVKIDGISKPGNNGEVVNVLKQQYRNYTDAIWSRKEI
ncbi:aminodeoxychorismate lyase [Bacillus sp. Bva_UNVM-123]|uniref:aminodeoxychorismate lyase n=1 Tax=Bacillus sp. Bva_UNVM-123 TaxID=2829798 RepID=UPI00391F8D3E